MCFLCFACVANCADAQPDVSVPAVPGGSGDAFGISGWLFAFLGTFATVYWWHRAAIAEASLAVYVVGIKDGAALTHQTRWCTCGCMPSAPQPTAQPVALRARAVSFQAGVGAWPHYPDATDGNPVLGWSALAFAVLLVLLFYAGAAVVGVFRYVLSPSSVHCSRTARGRIARKSRVVAARAMPFAKRPASNTLWVSPPPGLSLVDNFDASSNGNASSTAPSCRSVDDVGVFGELDDVVPPLLPLQLQQAQQPQPLPSLQPGSANSASPSED